jgi:ubiquinone/menaquinone biosynthesis C-methylase UbiE
MGSSGKVNFETVGAHKYMVNRGPNFTGSQFKNKAQGFDAPTRLPRNEAERIRWQDANKTWWQSTPMRYDWREKIPFEYGTREYFQEIDRRFLESAEAYLPSQSKPFDQLIPYSNLRGMDVLEIGVGQGTHAQLIAGASRNFTGIDLTDVAEETTAKRLATFGLPGTVVQMDAEAMTFADATFDFIWSWGVIHHSADTRRVLREMGRVLRPGGRAIVMVYHRTWWNYYVVYGFLKGILLGQLRKDNNLHHVAQKATDGAIARFYRPNEWREVCRGIFEVKQIRICGLKNDVIPLPPGKLKYGVEKWTPNAITRFLTNTCRMGSFLIADIRRI